MLDVALIGLGSDWNQRFRPALQNLQKRIRVRGVYSAVGTLAEQAASEFSCAPSTGISALVSRSNIRGVVILDPGLCPLFAVDLVSRLGKPAFLARSVLDATQTQPGFSQGLPRSDALAMPSCLWRYHPATTRLRELLATRLGRPQRIQISVSPRVASESPATTGGDPIRSRTGASDLQLWDLFDWCRFLLGTPVQSLQAVPTPGMEGRQTIRLDFFPSVSGAGIPQVSVECPVDRNGSAEIPANSACHLEVQTSQGRAVISSPTEIAWETATERAAESLEKDRCAVEVMLDHFARRTLGGLIPVPNLEDVSLAQNLVAKTEESLWNRKPVVL